jgi:hypothetical protein
VYTRIFLPVKWNVCAESVWQRQLLSVGIGEPDHVPGWVLVWGRDGKRCGVCSRTLLSVGVWERDLVSSRVLLPERERPDHVQGGNDVPGGICE